MVIQYPLPTGQQINEGATPRQWMMPGGVYFNEAGAALPMLYVIT